MTFFRVFVCTVEEKRSHARVAAQDEGGVHGGDGEHLPLHHADAQRRPEQGRRQQGPRALQALLGQDGPQQRLLEPRAAEAGPAQQPGRHQLHRYSTAAHA